MVKGISSLLTTTLFQNLLMSDRRFLAAGPFHPLAMNLFQLATIMLNQKPASASDIFPAAVRTACRTSRNLAGCRAELLRTE